MLYSAIIHHVKKAYISEGYSTSGGNFTYMLEMATTSGTT